MHDGIISQQDSIQREENFALQSYDYSTSTTKSLSLNQEGNMKNQNIGMIPLSQLFLDVKDHSK
jgi:hypothetical protein